MNASAAAEPTERGAATDSLWSPGRRSLTIGLVLNVTIVASEALAVSTIMPIVAKDLGGLDLYGWVFSGFFLGSLLGIVVAGIMIDRGGLTRPFLTGIGLFSLGLLIGGLAPTMGVLVAARVIQGFGAGAIPAVAYVSIGRALPERLRPRMFATLSTAWVIPGVIGPSLAGIVAETLNWRLVFLGLLPLIAIAVVADPARDPLRGRRPPTRPRASTEVAVDARRRLPLAMVLVAGAALTVAGLSNLGPAPVPLVVAGLLIGTPAFARLTPPGTIRAARGMPAAVLLRGFLTFAFFCADAYVPLAIQDWRGEPALVSGLVFTASTLSWTGGCVDPGPADRAVRAPPVPRDSGSSVLVARDRRVRGDPDPDVPLIVAVVTWSVAGLGMGLSYSTPAIIVLRDAPAELQGASTAGLQLSDVLGTSLGTGLGGALIAGAARSGSEGWVGLALTFAVSIAVAVVGLTLTPRVRRRGAVPAPARGTGAA